MDYGFLVGEKFRLAGYRLRVTALLEQDDKLRICAQPLDDLEAGAQYFTLSDVLPNLIADEEIVLFHPHFSIAS